MDFIKFLWRIDDRRGKRLFMTAKGEIMILIVMKKNFYNFFQL